MPLPYDSSIENWQGSLPQYNQNYNSMLGDYGSNLTLGQLISMSRNIRESMAGNNMTPGNQAVSAQRPVTTAQIPAQVANAIMADQNRLLSTARKAQGASGGQRSSFEAAPSLIEGSRAAAPGGGSASPGGSGGSVGGLSGGNHQSAMAAAQARTAAMGSRSSPTTERTAPRTSSANAFAGARSGARSRHPGTHANRGGIGW